MKQTLLIFIISLLCHQLTAQNRPLGSWKTYLPYQQANCLTEVGPKVFVGTKLAMFSKDREDNTIQTYSTVEGLSDLDIVAMDYQDSLDILVVIYASGILDLRKNGAWVQMSDIKRANLFGAEFYNLQFIDDLVYISTSFGIVVLDPQAEEIVDTYTVGLNGEKAAVYQVAKYNNQLYAASEGGLVYAAIDNPNLSNFANWTLVDKLDPGAVTQVVQTDGAFFAVHDHVVYKQQSDGDFMPIHGNADWYIQSLRGKNGKVLVVEWRGSNEINSVESARVVVVDGEEKKTYDQGFLRPSDVLMDDSGTLWVSDFWVGLYEVVDGWQNQVLPNGPNTNGVFNMTVWNNDLWVMPGGYKSDLDYNFSRSGFFLFRDGFWTNFRNSNTPIIKENDMTDFSHVVVVPSNDKVYLSSYGIGLLEKDGDNFTLFNQENSTLGEALGDAPGRIRVSGFNLDLNSNLWVSNALAANPISVYKADGTWKSFKPTFSIRDNALSEMVIDATNQKWMIAKAQGIVVFNHGETIEDIEDDQYKLLTTANNLPTNDVTCLSLDRKGRIWVGTLDGVTVFFCPDRIFEEGCTASKFNIDGKSVFLLRDNAITDIAVDGANRKWIGTTTGLWLMSEDGQETLNYFNTDNSPLLSNQITAIKINSETGEVFIGTDRGIVSYQGDAISGSNVHGDVLVYPNPVRPEYKGDIAIKGLARNAFVKITDISGNLVHETRALGSQAIWNGNDYNGRRASSGVYLVFSVSEDGEDTFVAKLLLVN